MINLNLAIYEGDVQLIKFHGIPDLCEYIENLRSFNCVWLVTDSLELIVTENIGTILTAIKKGIFVTEVLHIHEYQTYQDAYAVALDMQELNPKCYN
jgi:hypothetical protein